MAGDLRPLLIHLPAWLLVLFRLTGIFIFAPVLGSNEVPRQVKVFLAVGLSLCVYPTLLEPGRPAAPMVGAILDNQMSIWMLGAAVGVELLIGLAIGYAASLPLIGMQIGGQVIDQQVGLGLAGIFNPDLGEQSGMVGQFLFIVALALFIVLGGHRIMFAVLIGSFDRVPLGGFTEFESLVYLMVGLLQVSFDLALRIAAPLLCLTFLQTVAMGFVARTVPQINILSIGFPMRTLMGALLLMMFIGIAAQVYTNGVYDIFRELLRFWTVQP
ncbi:MAG: flagellar biosynthetic protein FliR [Phycisphaeraceae bacterium]